MKRATFKLGPEFEFLPIVQIGTSSLPLEDHRTPPWLRGYLEAAGFAPGDVVEITDGPLVQEACRLIAGPVKKRRGHVWLAKDNGVFCQDCGARSDTDDERCPS